VTEPYEIVVIKFKDNKGRTKEVKNLRQIKAFIRKSCEEFPIGILDYKDSNGEVMGLGFNAGVIHGEVIISDLPGTTQYKLVEANRKLHMGVYKH